MAIQRKPVLVDAEFIRRFATDSFVEPAKARGETVLTIPVRVVATSLKKFGFKSGRIPAVCSALGGKRFQQQNGIVLDRRDGPPSGLSPTVVFHFRLPDATQRITQISAETSKERANRLTEKLRGLLKDEIAAYGGTEAFMRWVRSGEESA